MMKLKYVFLLAVALRATALQAQVSATVDAPASVRPGEEFRISVKMNKPGVNGFAKLEYLVPIGFDVAEDESAGSTFRYKDGKVKYLWMALPNTDSFTISYLLTVGAEMSGTQILEGTFSYVESNDTKKFQLPKTILLVSKDASNQELVSSTKPEPKLAQTGTQRPITPANDDRSEPEKTKTYRKRVTSVVDAYTESDGLVYRVQVLAGNDMRDAEAIAATYGITERIAVTEHDGMYKYVVGEFNIYQSAKTLSNELRNTTALPGPFVVAYKDGYRITTAEALQHLTDNLNKVEQQIQSRTQQFSN